MKLIHLSDLHIGKRLNEFSLIEDQNYILNQIADIVRDESADAVLICGDVYDRTIPTAEALGLFDGFLCTLQQLGVQTFVISGNHDSAERLAFASRLIDKAGVHICPAYTGEVPHHRLCRAGDSCDIYMLPFVKPSDVRPYFANEKIDSYTDAVRAALSVVTADGEFPRILMTHQFVTGAVRSDSEEISVGGTDGIGVSVFSGFDYVALGHIHRPQSVWGERVRYCGSPLAYSFSEAGDEKSLTVIEVNGGAISVRVRPLSPLRRLFELRAEFDTASSPAFYSNLEMPLDSYFRITLTDAHDVPDAMLRLRKIYPNLMRIDYSDRPCRSDGGADGSVAEDINPYELFSDFYEMRNGAPLTDYQRVVLRGIMKDVWEE